MPRPPRPPALRFLPPLAALALAAALAAPAPAVTLPPVFALQWGTPGSGNGQLNQPSGIAVDGAGDVYVVDTGNHRVQKFSSAGAYLMQWGGLGSGNGQLNAPTGIAIRWGRVYVVDSGNFRVQQFTTSGAYVLQWGGLGSGNGQFQQPRGIAIDGAGQVYVSDAALNRIQVFSSSGSYNTQWGTTGSGNGQFNGPGGIAVDNAFNVYVTDGGNHRVQRFAFTSYAGQWGTLGSGNGQFSSPADVVLSGGDVYVVDGSNHRLQIFTPAGGYQSQWGNAGSGPGQFQQPRAAAAAFGAIYVADRNNHRVQRFDPAPPEHCEPCLSPPDTCCAAPPQVGGPWTNPLVGTRQQAFTSPYAVTLFDLTSPPPTPSEDEDWALVTRYHGPGNSWRADSLGNVFGLTLDKFGNIFVTHTSCYQGDAIGQVFGAAAGAVYRIDGASGAITTFCVLPNAPDGSVTVGENLPGLGNVTYDCRNEQLFVTNLEDGKIYRIRPTGGPNGVTGTVVQTFDPLAPDNGFAGWAPHGELLWGIQWHGDRVYYAVWAEDAGASTGQNEIRSVGLLPNGAIDPPSDRHELFLPDLQGETWSMPVADISFSASGKMLLGERGIFGKTDTYPHVARVLEYVCSGGCWVPGNQYLIGDYGVQTNAGGGVDYDRQPFGGPGAAIGRVWASGDALHLYGNYPDVVYGYQGLRPTMSGSNVTSRLIDSDGDVVSGDKTFVGDVEAPGCPAATTGTVCGLKFLDADRDGIRDPGEPGLQGWTIQLHGPGGPWTATTDVHGNYCFTVPPGTYTLSEVGVPGTVQTAPSGGSYTVTVAAGQTLYHFAFGNYQPAAGGTPPCAPPPIGMAAWWPFNEPVTSTIAADVTHTAPPRNVAQLVGGAAITAGGQVGRALCFPSELDEARVPIASQLGLQFGGGPFAIDVWVQAPAGAGPRVIAEKRQLLSSSPYLTRGWALALNGLQCVLEIGTGSAVQTVPGPTLPASAWAHVAVSVSRAPAAGRWYLNGVAVPSFDFVPIPGPVSSVADLVLGQASAPFGSAPLLGCIDELELFNTTLPAATVAQIHAAGALGKCPEYCRLPQVTTICKDKASVQVCFNLCNHGPTAQTYSWSLAGQPAGTCSVNGPTVFQPAAGSVTVAGGSCSTPICVTIPRPPGLTVHNATACYALTFANQATGATFTCSGTLRADHSCWCATPLQTGVVAVGGRQRPTGIVIGVGGPCDPPVAVTYRLVPSWTDPSTEDPLLLALNGLPPGEPWIDTRVVGAGGEPVEITAQAAFERHDAAASAYEVALETDLDGDGVWERGCGTLVASSYDSIETAGAGGSARPTDSVRLAVSPNPFHAGAGIGFSLARRERVDLAIHDLGGRRVRTLRKGTIAAGPHRFEWNGTDERGRPAAPGVYFVRLETERLHLRAKVVKLD